jgi:lipid-A-disaccharide synthase
VALAGVPMLVAYRVNPITAAIAKRLIKVRFASLVNLLADRAIAPEFIQHDCTPDLLAPALATLLDDSAAREAQRDGFRASLAQLAGPGGVAPSQAAASCVLGWLKPA